MDIKFRFQSLVRNFSLKSNLLDSSEDDNHDIPTDDGSFCGEKYLNLPSKHFYFLSRILKGTRRSKISMIFSKEFGELPETPKVRSKKAFFANRKRVNESLSLNDKDLFE